MNTRLVLCRRLPPSLLLLLSMCVAPAACLASDSPDDGPRFDQAMSVYADGHYVEAARQLQVAASGGDLRALEVLALMNLYGSSLYGAGPWDKGLGRALLRDAGRRGSQMAAALDGQEGPSRATAHLAVSRTEEH